VRNGENMVAWANAMEASPMDAVTKMYIAKGAAEPPSTQTVTRARRLTP